MIFNIIFLLINGYKSAKLIMRLIPAKFTEEERKLYNKYFYRYMKPGEYKKLLKYSRRRVYRVNSTIIKQGNGFSSLFFIVDFKNVKIDLKLDGKTVKVMRQYGWVGILEYVEILSKKSLSEAVLNEDLGSWGVTMQARFDEEEIAEEVSEKESEGSNLEEAREGGHLIIYEWDFEVYIY
jgi:hypothetical protein